MASYDTRHAVADFADDLFPAAPSRQILSLPIEDRVASAVPTTYVVDKLIPERACLILAGPPKKGRKTFTAMYLALCVGRGQPFLGFKSFARPVYYVFLEDGIPRASWRWSQFGVRPDDLPRSNVHDCFEPALVSDLVQKLQQQKCLIVIDSLSVLAMHTGVKDENSATEMTAFLSPYQNAVRNSKTGSSIIMVHHHAKHLQVMRGSSALNAVSDGWIDVTVVSKETRKLSFTVRDLEEDMELSVRMVKDQNGNLTFVRDLSPAQPDVDSAVDRYAERIAVLIASNPSENYWTMSMFASQIGISASNDSLRQAVNRLVADGVITKSGSGRGAGYRPTGTGTGTGTGNGNGTRVGF